MQQQVQGNPSVEGQKREEMSKEQGARTRMKGDRNEGGRREETTDCQDTTRPCAKHQKQHQIYNRANKMVNIAMNEPTPRRQVATTTIIMKVVCTVLWNVETMGE